MKYITLKNVERATRMIANKGYEWKEANDIAIGCFEECANCGYQFSVEHYINMIISKAEYEEMYK